MPRIAISQENGVLLLFACGLVGFAMLTPKAKSILMRQEPGEGAPSMYDNMKAIFVPLILVLLVVDALRWSVVPKSVKVIGTRLVRSELATLMIVVAYAMFIVIAESSPPVYDVVVRMTTLHIAMLVARRMLN